MAIVTDWKASRSCVKLGLEFRRMKWAGLTAGNIQPGGQQTIRQPMPFSISWRWRRLAGTILRPSFRFRAINSLSAAVLGCVDGMRNQGQQSVDLFTRIETEWLVWFWRSGNGFISINSSINLSALSWVLHAHPRVWRNQPDESIDHGRIRTGFRSWRKLYGLDEWVF